MVKLTPSQANVTNYAAMEPTDICLVKNDGPYISYLDSDHLRIHKGILFRFKEGNSFLHVLSSFTYSDAKKGSILM